MINQIIVGPGIRLASLKSKALLQQHDQPKFQKIFAYRKALLQRGAYFHPHIYYSLFQLKNGCQIPGLACSQDLPAETQLIRLPKELLLNTRLAYENMRNMLDQEYQFFRVKYWQDKTLNAYLLHLYYTKKPSLHQHMLENMHRDVDLLCCWPEAELDLLKDQDFKRSAMEKHSQIQQDFLLFRQVAKRHPDYFPEVVKQEDYWWVQVHLVSRCFGSFQYTTMIPFMEFFNHSVSDVAWEGDCQAKERWLDEEERASLCSSDASYNQVDQQNFEEFDYSRIRYYSITWVSEKNKARIDEKTLQRVKTQVDKAQAWLYFNLDWGDNLSFVYCAQFMQKLRSLHAQFLRGTRKQQSLKLELEGLESQGKHFKDMLQKYYSRTRGPSFNYCNYFISANLPRLLEPQANKPRPKPTPFPKYPEEWTEDKFQTVSMKTTPRDEYRKGDQLFYCYGRLSNRQLLQRYGFALSDNRYDKAYLRVFIGNYIQEFPDFAEMMQVHQISLVKRLKLKRYKFCQDLLTFQRALKWRENRQRPAEFFYPEDLHLQIECADLSLTLLEQQLRGFGITLKEARQKVKQKSSYHQYFANVYILGRIEILTLQRSLLERAKEVLLGMTRGVPLKQLQSTLSKDEQRLLSGYLSNLRKT